MIRALRFIATCAAIVFVASMAAVVMNVSRSASTPVVVASIIAAAVSLWVAIYCKNEVMDALSIQPVEAKKFELDQNDQESVPAAAYADDLQPAPRSTGYRWSGDDDTDSDD